MMRILSNKRGATAVEFALVAPTFLMFMFLIIDGARAVWTYQTLQEVAVNSARCAGLKLTGCTDNASVQTYASNRAANFGVPLATTAVTLNAAATCQSTTGMTMVTITSAYQATTFKLLPTSVSSLTTYGCFPTAS